MPSKRQRRGHTFTAPNDELQRAHLELGDCLLAGPDAGCLCGLRRRDGVEDEQSSRAARLRLRIPEDEWQQNDNE